jgi:hypothetical protein
MLIEEALITHLLAQTFTTTYLTGTDGKKRIYPVIAPQDVATPYIVVFKVDSLPEHSHDGDSHLDNPRFQVSNFSTNYAEAKLLAALGKTALVGYSGTMGGAGGVDVNGVFKVNETDLFEENTKLFHVAVDYKMWHRE